MKIEKIGDNSFTNKQVHYVPIGKKQEPVNKEIIKSKVLIIDNIEVNISEKLNGDFSFNVYTTGANLQDGKIPKIDITCNEDISFDEDLSLKKLEAIIRRCGVLEEYSEYFTRDPEIVINSYTLKLIKEYEFFNEFKDGVLTAQEIFM